MYITFIKGNKQQITLDELYNNIISDPKSITVKTNKENYAEPPTNLKTLLKRILTNTPQSLWNTPTDALYSTFHIPKRSGGTREISAPCEQLKQFQTRFKDYLEQDCKILTHNAAHGYVKRRGTFTALKTHQSQNNNYFLKLDIKDFFPSCSTEQIITQLQKVYPLNILLKEEDYKEDFIKALKLCTKNNALPQGSPASPVLTNILMIPFDYELSTSLNKFNYTYTRYADDILISHKDKWNFNKTVELIDTIFSKNNYNFSIKREKTRFGSKNGRNWNLGLMLNKDNDITIGHDKKQKFRANIFQFANDLLTNNHKWSIIETQELLGLISYYKMIEPDYVNYVINKYNRKFNTNIYNLIKEILK